MVRLAHSPLIAVVVTVLLGLLSAMVLKAAADQPSISMLALVLVFGVVVTLNGLRFVLWGWVYRRHPVGLTYPLGATIFPLFLVVGHVLYGEPVTLAKVVASVLIMVGVTLLSADAGKEGSRATS